MIDLVEVQSKKCEECQRRDAVETKDIGRMRSRNPADAANKITVVQVCETCRNKTKYSAVELGMDSWSSRHRVGS